MIKKDKITKFENSVGMKKADCGRHQQITERSDNDSVKAQVIRRPNDRYVFFFKCLRFSQRDLKPKC